jgi:hypothetical protein
MKSRGDTTTCCISSITDTRKTKARNGSNQATRSRSTTCTTTLSIYSWWQTLERRNEFGVRFLTVNLKEETIKMTFVAARVALLLDG